MQFSQNNIWYDINRGQNDLVLNGKKKKTISYPKFENLVRIIKTTKLQF